MLLLVVDDGWSRILWGGLGLLVLWQLRPRPARVDRHAVALPASAAPDLHALCAEVAAAVGARPPERVVVGCGAAGDPVGPPAGHGRSAQGRSAQNWAVSVDPASAVVEDCGLRTVETRSK